MKIVRKHIPEPQQQARQLPARQLPVRPQQLPRPRPQQLPRQQQPHQQPPRQAAAEAAEVVKGIVFICGTASLGASRRILVLVLVQSLLVQDHFLAMFRMELVLKI